MTGPSDISKFLTMTYEALSLRCKYTVLRVLYCLFVDDMNFKLAKHFDRVFFVLRLKPNIIVVNNNIISNIIAFQRKAYNFQFN